MGVLKRLQPAHVGKILMSTQCRREKQPRAGVPVVCCQQQTPVGHINHRRTGRVAGAMDDLHPHAAKIHRLFVQRQGHGDLCRQKIFGHHQALPLCLSKHTLAGLGAGVGQKILLILMEHHGFVKPPGAQAMVMMAVGNHNAQGQICQRTDESVYILGAVTGVHQQGGLFAHQQRHANAHGIFDVMHARQYFVGFKRHSCRLLLRIYSTHILRFLFLPNELPNLPLFRYFADAIIYL